MDQHHERGDRRHPAAGGEEHQRHQTPDGSGEVRQNWDRRPGRRSSGKLSKNFRLIQRGLNTGLLLIIVEMTKGKCLLSFDVAAPSQITRQTSLAAMIMSAPANRNAAVSDAYTSPRAARKITLSRSPRTASNPRTAQISHSGRMKFDVGAEFGYRPGAVGEDSDHQNDQ